MLRSFNRRIAIGASGGPPPPLTEAADKVRKRSTTASPVPITERFRLVGGVNSRLRD